MKRVTAYRTILDEGNAYWMARLAREVYYSKAGSTKPDEARILGSIKKDDPGFIAVKSVDNDHSQAVLVEHKDYICMSFRGTDEVADWLNNINVFSTETLFGRFHRGFWHALEDVWEFLVTQNASMQKEKKRPLFLTGHSLGGAMANLATARLVHDDKPFVSTYTFGQPRTMSRSTARIFNMEAKARYFRFHNNNDIVTRIPARLMGYSHVGHYVYISQDIEISEDPGFWYRFLDQVEGALESTTISGLDGVADHNMDHYLAAIEKWKWSSHSTPPAP